MKIKKKKKKEIVLDEFNIQNRKKKVKKKRLLNSKLFDFDVLDHVKRNKKKGRRKTRIVESDRKRRRKLRDKVVDHTIALTKTGIQFTEEELIASLCRDSFFYFVKEFWSTIISQEPVWNWHIEYLCKELQEMALRMARNEVKEYDLVVNIPPGTTKSTIMSVMFPAWLWTIKPDCQFIGASHSEDLALDLSVKTRDIIKSDKYRACFPEIQIREDQDTKTNFKNTAGGWRYAVGVSGSVIGKHAHVIVLDDPIDVLKAMSAAELKKTNYWISNQLSNRKVNKDSAITILVMQRLHQEDPTAAFLKKKKVKHICLPAERSEKISPPELRKFYNKLGGRLLDPIRLSHKILKEEKEKGRYYYNSQFQQDPIPLGGGMFKVFRIKAGILPLKFKRVVRYWDKAGTLDGGAFSVGVKMAMDYDGRFWILDIIRVQLDSFEREKLILRTAHADGYNVRIGIEQEPGSGGKESAENTVRSLAGYKVTVQKAAGSGAGGLGSKTERADPYSVQVNAGNVYIPEHFWDKNTNSWKQDTWVHEYLEELQYFPNSKFKDQVDASSGAFSICFKPVRRVGGMKKQAANFSRKSFLQQFI